MPNTANGFFISARNVDLLTRLFESAAVPSISGSIWCWSMVIGSSPSG